MAVSKRSGSPRVGLPGWKFPTRARVRAASSAVPVQDRESFYRTIRFRLTAWYALVLIVVIVATSFTISTSVARALQQETDNRLCDAATQIYDRTDVQEAVEGIPSNESDPRDPVTAYITVPPDAREFVLSGLWIQYVNNDGTLAKFNAGDETEPNASENVNFPSELVGLVDTSPALESGDAAYQSVRSDDLVARALILPLKVADASKPEGFSVIGAIIVGVSRDTQESAVDVVNQILQVAGVAGVVLAVLAGWLVAGRALSPVKKITVAAESVSLQPDSVDSLAIRIDVPKSGDELSHLASTFNTMLSRIEDAFSVQRRFVADASHELRTPLTAIRGNVDVLLRQAKSDRTIDNDILIESLDDVRRESSRMGRLIDDLLTLARDDTRGAFEITHQTLVSLDNVARDAFDTLEPLATDRFLVLDAPDRVDILGDADRLTQVMLILGENALSHTPAGGTVTISVDRATGVDGEPDCARISVRDTGAGIAAEHLPHIFERFYRASGARERGTGGTGLGLSIALGIVRAHGGWIDVKPPPTVAVSSSSPSQFRSRLEQSAFRTARRRLPCGPWMRAKPTPDPKRSFGN